MKAPIQTAPEQKTPMRRGGHWLSAALVWGTVACTGQIAGTGGDSPTDQPGGTQNPGGGGGGGKPIGGGGVTPPAAVDPGTKVLHRLNTAEYNATVADILGTKLQPANSSWLGGEIGGFDNIAAILDVNEAQYGKYFEAARLIADDVFAAADLKAKIVTCTTDDDACVQGIISTTGRRLFRRPLTNDEVGTYHKVYKAARTQSENHDGGIRLVVRAFLSSAEFLFRVEFDPKIDSTDKHPLNAYELASRLSYFLWSSAPDDALLAAAADGTLTQEDKLRAQVDRMLADTAKSSRFVENFSGQWLGARKLPAHATSPTVYPDWTPAVANTLTKEMYLYFTEFLKSDRTWLDFMKADINFADASVSKLYGAQATGNAGPQRLEIKDDQRFGFAGLAGFLAMSSLGERTSPTLRGRWILSNLLCTEPPPPPPGVADLGVGGLDPTKNVRIALEEHRKAPACAACHSLFDPYGLSLEQFDGIGKYRATYSDGTRIDPTAELAVSTTFPQGLKFSGIQGLADAVTMDPKFSECVSEFMFTYGLGRQITNTDKPYLEAIHHAWTDKGTPSIRRLVQELVVAETFRSRRGAAAK